MTKTFDLDRKGAALAADAAPGLRPSGAEPPGASQAKPLVPSAVRLVFLCDESGRKACCQEVAVVADLAAFEAYAKTEYRDARGTPERGYDLYGPNGEDLNFTLVTTEYEVLTASAIEARRAETGTGSVHESPAPSGETPND